MSVLGAVFRRAVIRFCPSRPPGSASDQTLGVRLPAPFGVDIVVQVPFGTSLKALP